MDEKVDIIIEQRDGEEWISMKRSLFDSMLADMVLQFAKMTNDKTN